MKRTMVQYTVRPDEIDNNERDVARVFEELARRAPPGLRYASFRVEDSARFVHIVFTEDETAESPLMGIEAFRAFTSRLKERCVVAPVVTTMLEVGAFGF